MKKEVVASWKEDCGCKVSAEHYIKMCPAHQKEKDELRAKWAADYARTKTQ